ncbi:MAG: glycine betaine ABC transporter substrate-binding protein [Gemmatimonadota bacterium]
MRSRSAAAALALAVLLGFGQAWRPSSASAQEGGRIVVGSKNFTESAILGEIMAQLLRDRTDLEVVHRQSLGGTLVCFQALRSGEIDLYPEYTGTGWSIILEEPERIDDRLRAYVHVDREFRERYGLEWLSPFGLNNTYALAMDRSRAEELGVTRISDLIEVGPQLDAGFSIEFTNRQDGWPGLRDFYGIELGRMRALEHGLAYEAIDAGAIDLMDAYSTDGKLLRFDLRVLDDDRGFFPPYNAAPLVREETLAEHPEVQDVLELLAFRVTNDRIIELNDAVESEGEDPAAVARSFLVSEGLIGESAEVVSTGASRSEGSFLRFFVGRWRETARLSVEHLQLTLIAVLLATLLAVPLGIWVTRHPLAERLTLSGAGAIQTVPSLALLAFMIAVPGLGLSVRSAIVALFLYSILPILRNTHTGIQGVDPELLDAAKGLGLTPRQILVKIQLPIATRTILAGVRTATVISIGIATLAAFIGAGGLGEPIVTGLYLNDTRLILAGALPAAVLALVADYLLGRLERFLTPRGLLSADG